VANSYHCCTDDLVPNIPVTGLPHYNRQSYQLQCLAIGHYVCSVQLQNLCFMQSYNV